MNEAYVGSTGKRGMTRSVIPYQREPTEVGDRPQRLTHPSWTKGYFPPHRYRADWDIDAHTKAAAIVPRKIECRLMFDKYTAEEADDRCQELHGTTFEGRYVAGRYFTYWSYA